MTNRAGRLKRQSGRTHKCWQCWLKLLCRARSSQQDCRSPVWLLGAGHLCSTLCTVSSGPTAPYKGLLLLSFSDVPKVTPVEEHGPEWRQSSSRDFFTCHGLSISLTKTVTRNAKNGNRSAWSHSGLWPSRESVILLCDDKVHLVRPSRDNERES